MRANPKEPQPVRLANPTAESFVAALKVVHFFAVFFFWLTLVALLVHLAAFAVFQAGRFDAALGLRTEAEAAADQTAGALPPEAEPAHADADPMSPLPDRPDEPWWSGHRAPQTLRYVTQVLATMRLVGLLTSMLLLVTLFVYLEISLLGRLAGVRYLTISFFLVMVFVATVYSWEPLLPGARVLGSLFAVDDFLNSYIVYVQRADTRSLTEWLYHWGRFLVVPVCSLVLLVASWLRFRRGYEESVLMNE